MLKLSDKKMKRAGSLLLIILIAGYTTGINAQVKNRDSLYVLRDYAKLWKLYQQQPVEISIEIQNTANHITAATDTMNTEMNYYISSHDVYLQAEGLEEVVNDSLIIMVNNQAKRIMLYRNSQPVMKSIEKSVAVFLPDSSIEKFARNYFSTMQEAGQNKKRIELRSRVNVFGTAFPRETISVLYKEQSFEPIELEQTKLSLVPIDSVVYAGLVSNHSYDGELVTTVTGRGRLFFIVKKLTTVFRFKKILYNVQYPPVKENDRISKNENGEYVPAKGYEEYVLSKEF